MSCTCSVCGCAASARVNRAALTCSSCIGESLAHLRDRLATLCAQRDALRSQASVQLQLEAKARRASALASRLETRLDRLRRSRELLAAELREVATCAQQIQQLRSCSDSIEAAQASHAALWSHRVSAAMPRALRDAQLQHRLVMQTLGSEKQRAIAALRLALPLHWKRAPLSGRSEEPAFIRICGAVLPTCGDSSATSAEQLAAGLGSLLHFVSLASRYLACPLLLVGSYRGSTSTVWRRTSFWSDAGSMEMPLYRGGDGLTADDGAANRMVVPPWPSTWSSTAQRVGVVAPWATPGPGAVQQLAAFNLLSRSVSLLCGHELGLAGASAPPRTWSPLVLLAALCAGIAKPPAAQVDTPAASALAAKRGEDSEDDWEHLRAHEHLLPPPPGCPDDELQLWERLVSSTPPRTPLL